ncbi:uncharacterized protein LOC112139312 isoform X2 [Oryzias melastigma]|nr:uncharacterized protein LOC112139312 isoform X2 [Oryzias melastigma]
MWKKKDCEVVVAVIPSQMKGQNILIHHSELCSLRPHQWLMGEVMEGLLHAFSHTFSVTDNIYLLSHYTAGCILFGDRKNLPQQSLRKVNFTNYGAILSFVLVNSNHWNLLYIHAETGTVYLVDPAQKSSELKASQTAAKRIREYFVMRRTCCGKSEWVDVKWKGGVMAHPLQQDGCSCGVIVVKMAKAVIQAFPEIPEMTFSTSKKEMERERRDLALYILESSVFDEQNRCGICASSKPPGQGTAMIEWIQCDDCNRWFHCSCLSMASEDIEDAKYKRWECLLCQ